MLELMRVDVHHLTPKLLLIVRRMEAAQLQLQHELTDEAFFLVRLVGAEDGQFPGIDCIHVGADIGLVLVVNAAQVAKGSNAA